MGWALGSTYGDVRVCSGRSTSPLSAPHSGLNWEGTLWASGKECPTLCLPHRDAARCCPAEQSLSSDEELVIGRKRSPFIRDYSSPLEPFHLLSVVTPVGLLSLPSYPTELRPVIVGNDLNLFIHLHKMPCPLGREHSTGPQQQHPAALVQEQGMLRRR